MQNSQGPTTPGRWMHRNSFADFEQSLSQSLITVARRTHGIQVGRTHEEDMHGAQL
jgi:hypothetical protein